jgi:hypothetical protein
VKAPPVKVAGWSQFGSPESTVPEAKKFASVQGVVGSTVIVPRAKKASWFEPWFEVPSFPLAVNQVWYAAEALVLFAGTEMPIRNVTEALFPSCPISHLMSRPVETG